ncbi:MAG: hypothetical protein J1F11_10350 [Oscillospiraceae bacterium]|nr:hypothetical protein [Oscillospiraceae bacterium]
MDKWFDIILVLLGAVLGFGLSILTTIITRQLDKHGKLFLFYKLLSKESLPSNSYINSDNSECCLLMPLFFEFQNTSNTTRVIRDVNLYLYNQGKLVDKMFQIQYFETIKTVGKEEKAEIDHNYGGDKNSYSFVLPATSIQRQECLFAYKIPLSKKNEVVFDELRFAYYDEKNNKIESEFLDIPNGWNDKMVDICNSEFVLLNCCKSKKTRKKRDNKYDKEANE